MSSEIEKERQLKIIMRKFIILFCLLVSLSCLPNFAYAATVKFKMVAVNPSATEKTVPVKTFLPKGIRPQDITDKGKFEIGYDFERSLYYAFQEIVLSPQDSVTLELSMQNIWVIPEQEINSLKEHTQKIVPSLKNQELYAQAKILGENIINRLDRITQIQASAGIDIEQAISNYGATIAVLKEVKKDIGILEDLAIEAFGPAVIGKGGLMGEADLSVEPIKVQYAELDIEKLGTVKFKIEVSNPSDESSSVSLKYYLPVEVKPEYIVDKGGLEVGHDYQKNIHYVYKDGIVLAPDEKKEFIIQVKDVWIIPLKQIDVLKAHTEKLMGILGQSEYKALGEPLADKIISSLDNIINVQNNPNLSVEMHIGDYRENLKKLDEARKNIARLEKLVSQAGGPTALTTTSEEAQSVSRQPKTKKRVYERTQGVRGLELISKSIFRGKAPDLSTTWKIIWIILIFLALVSFLFFMLWWLQIKANTTKKRQE